MKAAKEPPTLDTEEESNEKIPTTTKSQEECLSHNEIELEE